ncbi:hypothetical protein SAMN04487846_3314 [Microbacterium sp. cf046]|uniref:hypothetical protein n=1 Tax=Microbacterium sp. cf046 TaxID=1761803 RepID=UPI0008E3C561|nr:hypothetical protein [Microbacterium sp. cf046]SFS16471.1 hypothetical protein SAMN04487846_3314 [Microbacterium sp. cf046]
MSPRPTGYSEEKPRPHRPAEADDDLDGPTSSEPPRPVNWNLLNAEQAETEWIILNRWVNWLRQTYGLPASVLPPLWHRHPELVWELSALHLHWLCAYDPDQHGSAPFGWHHDFADARQRLREWASTCGTRLDKDRPTRQTSWPGEPPAGATDDVAITNRDEDFVQFVLEDVERRREAERAFYATVGAGAV